MSMSFTVKRPSDSPCDPLKPWGPLQVWPWVQALDPKTVSFFQPLADWIETPLAHLPKVDLAGVTKEKVKVEIVDGNLLRFHGKKKRGFEYQEGTDTCHEIGREVGNLERKFQFPENAKVGEVKAAMQDGVLTITVTKDEPLKKPDVTPIDISG